MNRYRAYGINGVVKTGKTNARTWRELNRLANRISKQYGAHVGITIEVDGVYHNGFVAIRMLREQGR